MYDDIFMFVKLVDIGSFSALSRKLETTQATISRRIQNLETLLGVSLFHRNTRRLEVTDIGKQIYEKFRNQEANLHSLIEETVHSSNGISGTLRIALPIAISRTIITPHLAKFLAAYPKINLITSFITGQIELVKDGFDLAVSIVLPKAQNNIIKLLHKFNINLYVSSTYINKYGNITSLDQLGSNHILQMGILTPEGTVIKEVVAKNKTTQEERQITLNPRLSINNLLHAYEIAQSGEIIVAGWDSLLEPYMKTGEIVKILPEYSFGEIPCYLIRQSQETTALQSAFIDFIERCFDYYRSDSYINSELIL